MSAADIICLVLIAAALVFAVIRVKKGKSCGCSCCKDCNYPCDKCKK